MLALSRPFIYFLNLFLRAAKGSQPSPGALMASAACAAAILVAGAACLPAAAQADFGLVPGTTTMTALNKNGTLSTQAGSHPYSFSLHFELKTDENGVSEGGEMRDVIVDLPPGLIGNPAAVPSCPQQLFEGASPSCPLSTQVGFVKARLPVTGDAIVPVFNLTPPPGVAARFGFSAGSLRALQYFSLRSDEGYGLGVLAPHLPTEVTWVTETVWGVPSDPGHDSQRGEGALNGGPPVASAASRLAYLTLPASCDSPPQATVRIDSALNPGVFVGESAPFTDTAGQPQAMSGCESVPFSPKILSAPSTNAAESASGLGFELQLPNQGLLNPKDGVISETEPVRTEVTLPQGMTANPAAAGGLTACSEEQFKAATGAPGQGCPESSKLGTLIAHTPLLEEAIEGSVYLATPHANHFNSLVALYIVARAPERGITIKQAGEVQIDPATGQLTTIVDGLPPVPYSSFEVRLREGPRAPLITPQTCGSYTTTVRLNSFADPGTPVVRTAPFTISSGANGGNCASSEAQLPNRPTLEAGTTAPLAGAYSPFIFKLARSDGDQRFGAVEATLPLGLTGKLAGIPYCSEPQIAAAAARNREGEGALELAAPSCPSASQIGIVNVGAGAGSSPYYVQGKAYLAGPYKGAPLSIAIITPAIAGPFDLGVVVVRTALYVNESTAEIRAVSDPLPTILAGIPLDVRSVSLQMSRPSFVLNPTNCETKSVAGSVTSTVGQTAQVRNRFQVGGCKGLDFAPKLALSLKGATKRSGHPALKAVLTQPAGQANIGRVSVVLPRTEFIDNARIGNVCTRPQFSEGKCPPSSVLGEATAYSPLLDKPLSGKVYFRANGGERELPDVVADLNGQVHFVLVGFVDSVHKNGSEVSRIRNTFAVVPDAPVSKFVLQLKGGKQGLLVNSANLCKSPNKAVVKMTGQNGKTHNFNPAAANSCGKGNGKKAKLGTSHR
jgi:hypothetical protein